MRFSSCFNLAMLSKSGKSLCISAVLAGGLIWILLFHSMQVSSDDGSGKAQGIPSGIVWYGVLTDGLAEAKETGKPILLVSAAPNCAGVSGLW